MTNRAPQELLTSVPANFEEGPAWLRALRSRAAAVLRDQGLPTKKTEAWRFTPVRSITESAFARTARLPTAGIRVSLPAGAPSQAICVRSLRDVLRDEPGSIERQFGRSVDAPHFVALNTALFEDGVWIDVAPGAVIAEPIEIVYSAPHGAEKSVAYPRVLITTGQGSQASVIEHCAGRQPEHLTNAVVEVDLGKASNLKHVRVQQDHGLHIAYVDVNQAASSVYRSSVVTLGGALLRLDIHVALRGEGAEAFLEGAYVVGGQEHVDHHTRVEHIAPRCHSQQIYHGVIGEQGTAVFDGVVTVHRDAAKTEAHQENRNLLLSESASVHTKPHLEIDTDDVICSHGATVGSLDEDQLFYLRARGVPEDIARAMLIYAFVRDVIDSVPSESTRTILKQAVRSRIPHGDTIEEGL